MAKEKSPEALELEDKIKQALEMFTQLDTVFSECVNAANKRIGEVINLKLTGAHIVGMQLVTPEKFGIEFRLQIGVGQNISQLPIGWVQLPYEDVSIEKFKAEAEKFFFNQFAEPTTALVMTLAQIRKMESDRTRQLLSGR